MKCKDTPTPKYFITYLAMCRLTFTESIGESAHGTSEDEKTMYYYILVEGECVVVKDGKQVSFFFRVIH